MNNPGLILAVSSQRLAIESQGSFGQPASCNGSPAKLGDLDIQQRL